MRGGHGVSDTPGMPSSVYFVLALHLCEVDRRGRPHVQGGVCFTGRGERAFCVAAKLPFVALRTRPCCLTVPCTVCRYVENMLPKYMQRTMGCNAPYGRIVSINPGIIVALVPVVAALTAGLQHFDVIHCGAYITAISPFWVNWIPKPPIVGSALYVAIESIGESVWGPRWYDYTMEIAPTGKEGLFGAIAAAPLFLAKLPTGLLSGFLLDHFCPLVGEGCSVGSDSQCGGGAAAPGSAPQPHVERGKCDSALWVVVGVVTMTSPLLITAFSRWLKPTRGEYREGAGRADYAAAPVLEQ